MDDGGIHVTPSPASLERRMRYLDRVGEHLRMPEDRRYDVVEEIAAHLEDTIDALMAEGLSIDQAEREAMARLGSPEELGDELRRTHQTTKRLLAAVGGGVWHGLEGGVTGYFIAFVWMIPVMVIAAAIGAAISAVAPERAQADLSFDWFGNPEEGWVLVTLPTDALDWDRYPGLRLEAWAATSLRDPAGGALIRPQDGPYRVVVVPDPWTQPSVAVQVGKQGCPGFALFLVAQDPVTGARRVIGQRITGDATFHGSIVDWFASR